MNNKILVILSVVIILICYQCEDSHHRTKRINKSRCEFFKDMSYEGVIDTVFFRNKDWVFKLKGNETDEYFLYGFPHHSKNLMKGNFVKKTKGAFEYEIHYSDSDSIVLQFDFNCSYWDTLSYLN